MTSDAAYRIDDLGVAYSPPCWCAIYTRQSRGANDEFSSCEAQFEACFEFIQSRFADGWRLNGRRYDDVAESSETLDRPGLQRLLQDIRDGWVEQLVIHRLDRLSRRITDWTEFLQQLRDHDIPLTIVTQPDLGLNAEGTFFLNIAASFAEFEQEMTRERLADARAAHKRRGRRVAGVVPYGYKADPATKKLVIVRQEANRIRKMFQWAAEGKTPAVIAEIANKRRWRTKRRTSQNGRVTGGGKWTSRQILATLSNPVYAGLIHEGESTRLGIHEGIVDWHLFEDVRQQIESRRTRQPGRNTGTSHWPLRGLLHCGSCGRPMSPNTSGYRTFRYRYYRCRSTAGGEPPCPSVSVPAMEVEQFVMEILANPKKSLISARGAENGATCLLDHFADHWNRLDFLAQSQLLPEVVERVVFHISKGTIEVTFDDLALQHEITRDSDSAQTSPSFLHDWVTDF